MPNDAVSNLGKWLWYMVPANPILVRVVHGGGRRIRHLWYRAGYLGILFLMFLFVYLGSSEQMKGSLSEVAKTSTTVFRFIAQTQLLLVCILAPVFTAGAITQERDAETFNILLTTPLSNAQIIFGSLLSRLFFVFMLLVSGIPILCITMLYGGVTLSQIFMSFAIAGATALITGAIAICLSMVRAGTRKTIFSFLIAIGLYLLVVYALGALRFTFVDEAPPVPGESRQMSWLAALHPFLALEVGLNSVPAPALADVAHYGWPTKYLAAYPQVSYMVLTFLISLVLICFSMFFVRSTVKEGEPTLYNRLMWRLRHSQVDLAKRRRKPNKVWSNPVAWREASLRSSASTSILARYGMHVVGIVVSIWILLYLINGWNTIRADGTRVPFDVTAARDWLMWLLLIEYILILLVTTNAAASSMTKERESNTMDILLTTPLTSQNIVWGKLRGLVAFAVPMLAVPLINILTFVVYDLIMIGRNQARVVNFEAALELAGLFLAYTALASVIGLQCSLKNKKTVKAVIVSLTIMAFICGLLYLIVDSIVKNSPEVGGAIAPFTPFTAVKMLVDPQGYGSSGGTGSRITMLVGSSIAIVFYGFIVGGMYKSLVRNFDMTVRKQTAS